METKTKGCHGIRCAPKKDGMRELVRCHCVKPILRNNKVRSGCQYWFECLEELGLLEEREPTKEELIIIEKYGI